MGEKLILRGAGGRRLVFFFLFSGVGGGGFPPPPPHIRIHKSNSTTHLSFASSVRKIGKIYVLSRRGHETVLILILMSG